MLPYEPPAAPIGGCTEAATDGQQRLAWSWLGQAVVTGSEGHEQGIVARWARAAGLD